MLTPQPPAVVDEEVRGAAQVEGPREAGTFY
jgi:hypothetical protein